MMLHPVLIPIDPATSRTPSGVRRQREVSRQALGLSARLCGAPCDGWTKGDDGVPLPHEGFHWSVSHKSGLAAAVVAERPVGIDIEHVVPRRAELAAELASREEWELLGERGTSRFFRLWTAKEAALKAVGLGIGHFADCRLSHVHDDRHLSLVLDGATWRIEHYYLGDYVAAVASDSSAIQWHVEDAA